MAAAGFAQLGMGALQMVEAKNTADAMKRASEFDARQQEFNAKLVGIQKEEVLRQSGKDVDIRNTQVKQMVGSQKAAFAASGIA